MSKLSNADFRQIYETNRSAAPASSSSNKRKESNSERDNKPKKFKPARRPQPQTLAEKLQEYRDRAKERRSGKSQEYAITEDAVKQLTIEESKFLGGDMEHTHLVKGLDFALLAKIRADLDAKQQATEIQRSSDKTQGPGSLLGLEVKTPLGRFMRNVFLADGKEQKNKLDLFLPGRTTFSFDLDDDFGSEIPTTVSRSIDDLPYSTRDKKTAVINKTILSSISTIMDYIRQGSRPVAKKMKKKEKDDVKKPIAAAQAPRPAAVPEDDIFDDAGSYDLTMRAAASAANGHHGARR